MRREDRRKMRREGARTVKKHYGLLVLLSAIAIIFGAEFSGGALFLHLTDSQAPDKTPFMAEHSYIYKDPGIDVFRDIISGNVVEGVALSEELEEKYADSSSGALGHTEGVAATLIGTVTSGHLYVKILQAILTITNSQEISLIIFVILSMLVVTLLFALVREPYTAIVRRMFLEARTYDKVPFYHLFHLKHSQRWIRASLSVIYADFLYGLWFFTIAGAFVKRYSYYMVPYIIAEDPDVRPRQAVDLSRRMMDGHKMECFKLEMSMIGWLVLGFLTGGILTVFVYSPYKLSVMSEYYVKIRSDAKEAGLEGVDILNDDYLIEHADTEVLERTYRDTAEEKADLDKYDMRLTGVKRFFAENLAIWMGSMAAKEEYQRIENRRFQLRWDIDAKNALSYPDRLDPRLREAPLVRRVHTDFIRSYTLWNLLFMFFLFSFIGWIWEVMVFIVQTGEIVNRGSLYGPWVPIYGAGGTLILVILCKVRTRPLIEFFSIIVMCGFIEYMTSYVQEMATGQRYWDYSGYFLNLDGRICAEGLFAFAALGSLVVYFLAPMLDTLLMKIDNRLLVSVTVCLMVAFTADFIYAHIHPHTGKGITDMGRVDSPLVDSRLIPQKYNLRL